MDNIDYNEKLYGMPEDVYSKSMADMGILMFRYYPKEKMIINSNAVMSHLGCKRMYLDMPKSFAEDEVDEKFVSAYEKVYDDIGNGEKEAGAIFKLKEAGGTYMITLSSVEYDDEGVPEIVLGVIEDIDDVVSLIEKSDVDIEEKQRVAVATECEQQLLEHALNEAQKANKAKTEFLNNMSHDIRTPMNAIIGFATLAVTNIDDKEKVSDYLDKILMAGNQLLTLINNVLDMSNMESGKVQMDERCTSITELMKDLQPEIQDELIEKGITFNLDVSRVSNNIVYCDKLRLNQILLHVIRNAIKFTDGGGNIDVYVEEMNEIIDGMATYEIRISDNGIGMDEDFVKKIFVPFERERTSTVSGVQGTGLGMSITKKLVDMMNGTIKVESTQGSGTDITIRLPLRVAAETPDEEVNEIQNAEEIRFSKTVYLDEFRKRVSGKRLLLVEDNELNQEIESEILKEAGFTVDVADDGTTAVEMIKHSPADTYELILMDIQMPIMNGYEATMRIRRFKDKEKAAIPIIAMTANAFAEDRQTALKIGMDGYISKPISVSRLMNLLGEFLKVS
jgi:signal transduction histidine kinase/ActR/RegA family two-component response regulator